MSIDDEDDGRKGIQMDEFGNVALVIHSEHFVESAKSVAGFFIIKNCAIVNTAIHLRPGTFFQTVLLQLYITCVLCDITAVTSPIQSHWSIRL